MRSNEMKMNCLIAAMAILFLLAPAAMAKDGTPNTHRGFFLRLNLVGAGYGQASTTFGGEDMTVSGFAVNGDFGIGYAPVDNFIIHLNIFGPAMTNPTLTMGDLEADVEDTLVSMMGYGGGLTYYIMPYNIYATVTVGAAKLTLRPEDGDKAETDYGLSAQVSIGKEWWVSDNWGLGVGGSFSYSSLPEKNGGPTWTGIGASLVFSVTFN